MQKVSEEPNLLLKWRLSLAETVAACFTIASLTLWLTTYFQSKADANERFAQVDARVFSVEKRLDNMQDNMNRIAVDVSYIRGRLEPDRKGN
jgi:sensor domain CHASE-containing protein